MVLVAAPGRPWLGLDLFYFTIILNNVQYQYQKKYQQVWINSKIKQQHTIYVGWCYCQREVFFQKVCLFVVFKFVLHGKQFLVKQTRGID